MIDTFYFLLLIAIFSLISAKITFNFIENKRAKANTSLKDLKDQISQSEKLILELKNDLETARTNSKNETQQLEESLLAAKKAVAEKQNLTNHKYAELLKKDELINSKIRDLQQSLSLAEKNLQQKQNDLSTIEARTLYLVNLESRALNLQNQVDALNASQNSLQSETQEIEDYLQSLKSELDLYTRIKEFVGYGIYEEPEYFYETSERYQIEIRKIREAQRNLIKSGSFIDLPSNIEIDGCSKTGNSVLSGQAKIILRAFNIECDFLLGKLNVSNFDRTLAQIQKVAEDLEKYTATLAIGFTIDYIQLKFEECRLLYEYKLKKAAEDEEQKAIKEQIREEQNALREYERAIASAEKEELKYKTLLERANEKMQNAHENEKEKLYAQIQILENQLQEAQEKELRAKSMAEQTRKGHVYIISNIGSFGEEIYKIGLTRRLDPLDRVRELSDASVPFMFDVHAVIYSDDAPAMEYALHKHFNKFRVNAVNKRKEFFRVSLEEIKQAVVEISGSEASFTMTATAEEYYETLRLQGS